MGDSELSAQEENVLFVDCAQVFMVMLVIFCTNSINILAGKPCL